MHTIEQLHFDVMTRLSNSTIELENRSVLPSSISHGVQTDVIEYTFFVTIGEP